MTKRLVIVPAALVALAVAQDTFVEIPQEITPSLRQKQVGHELLETNLAKKLKLYGSVYTASQPTVVSHAVLWIGFACMALSCLYFVQNAYSFEVFQRKFHYVSAGICGFAALAYLCMALGIGATEDATGRVFFWARYIDWTVTTPLLLLDLGLLAGVHSNELIYVILMDILMIISGLIGGLYADNPVMSWPLFIFGMVTFLPIIVSLAGSMKEKALSFSPDIGARFNQLSVMTIVSWSAYPIVWVIAEGTKIVPVDVEVVLYGVLDVSAKCLFSFILLANRSIIERCANPPLQTQ